MSRTIYNNKGQPETREDYYIGSKPCSHFDKKTQTELKNHRHRFKYNEKDKWIGEIIEKL